jgi:N-acetylglucosamine-6-phosphate deacetylase
MTRQFPGFFDLQVNGFAGIDFNAPDLSRDRVTEALERMRQTGVTRCLPTLVTSSLERFSAGARVLAAIDNPAIAGIHMEGPYISRVDGPRGAHPLEYVCPASIDDFQRRQDAARGRIVLVTLAPETPGALPLIETLVASGVRVALGHTDAAPDQIRDAISAGASMATHLGNGCAQLLPRHPNVIWELLAADGVVASLIVDGHHVPPATVKAMVRAKGDEWTVLVTDAIAAAASPPGRYTIGGVDCVLGDDGRVSLPGTPYLAGSALTMDRAVGNTVRFTGLSIDTVLRMASDRPARYLGTSPAGIVDAEWDEAASALRVLRVTTRSVHDPPLTP